jgi:hypothetical protein
MNKINIRAMPDGYYIVTDYDIINRTIEVSDAKELIKCRNCKYFAFEEHWCDLGEIPVLAADHCPTCHKWGGKEGCMTSPDGFCFLAEKRGAEIE